MADFVGAQYGADEVLAGIKRDQVTGIPPVNMTTKVVKGGDAKITITYAVASETVVDGQVLCTTKGVMIRRKAGSAPTGINDGDLVANVTTLSGEIVDEGLINDTEYFYRFFPYSDHGVYNLNEANIASATPKEYTLYGFKIAKNDSNPATRVTYTEMAEGLTPAYMDFTSGVFNYGSWADAFFMPRPVMLKSNGTVDYFLNPNDLTKKEDGTASDIANTSYDGNAMMQFPTVYFKRWEDTNYEYVNICDIELDSSYKAYAHHDHAGNIMPFTYMSIYGNCGLVSSKLRSISGLTPIASNTATQERTYAKNNGSIYDIDVLADRMMINDLLALIGCSTNTQATFGRGNDNGGQNSVLRTGTMNDKGLFWGDQSGTKGVKVFGLENWWGNQWRRTAGWINASGTQKVKLTYGTEDGSTVEGYNESGNGYITISGVTPAGTSGGYINKSKMTEYGKIPYTASGSDSTYECDGLWFNNSQTNFALCGGSSYYGLLVGAFSSLLYSAASVSYWNSGAALSCKPLAA